MVNRHYHPHQVFAYTISGKWGYLEHDWVATAGDFVYEAPGEAHTLVAYESDEPMLVHFTVTGPLIWLDAGGEPESTFDVFDYIELCKQHYAQNGIGAAKEGQALLTRRSGPRTGRTRRPGGRGPRRRGRPA